VTGPPLDDAGGPIHFSVSRDLDRRARWFYA